MKQNKMESSCHPLLFQTQATELNGVQYYITPTTSCQFGFPRGSDYFSICVIAFQYVQVGKKK